MPITDMHFKDGIFYAREYGRIEKDDARGWADAVARHASESKAPIVALVDAMEVDYISLEARQVFVRASTIPNLKCAAVAARNLVTAGSARVIAIMAEDNHTHIFPSLEAASAFARKQAERAAEV
jgi:hypothetical protein